MENTWYNIIELVNKVFEELPQKLDFYYGCKFDLPLSIEAKDLITGEECLEILNSPLSVIHSRLGGKHINYDNLLIRYKDFPGQKNPNLCNRDDIFIRKIGRAHV